MVLEVAFEDGRKSRIQDLFPATKLKLFHFLVSMPFYFLIASVFLCESIVLRLNGM